MPLPGFFDKWSAPASGGADGNVQVLPFSIETQQATRWCWAAVAVSVSRFYDSASLWTQCALANVELGRTNCCNGGACNQDCALDRSLKRTGNFRWFSAKLLSVGSLAEEIHEGNPIGCRVEWQSGSGHFVVVYGVTSGGDDETLVHVADPGGETMSAGIRTLPYEVFKCSYLGLGTWTHSYALQPLNEG